MASPKDVYVLCDDLEQIPTANRRNYEYEHELLVSQLSKNSTILQVGSMDGMRAIRLLKARPDLRITGLEIEKSVVTLARQNLETADLKATFILGDITNPPQNLSHFDYVICLNNTLGYIPNNKQALSEMRQLGNHVFVSVYGEKFDEKLARVYFETIGLKLKRVDDDRFVLRDFSEVRRFTEQVVANWGGKTVETPLGYYCRIQ